MANPKDVLVVTASSVDGQKVKQYLKPLSAHLVAGTNLFDDFLGGLSDVFGGRSQAYQRQLASLYNEAIENIKLAAYEIGANCVLGLNIDMDEISGKGKSMFMLTAVGTAVILEKTPKEILSPIASDEKFENVSLDRIITLRKKKKIIEKATAGSLTLDEETWEFITNNQVNEVFPFLLKKFSETLPYANSAPDATNKFYKFLVSYLDKMPESTKIELLYTNVMDVNSEQLAIKLSEIITELYLFDFEHIIIMLKNSDFEKSKRALKIMVSDKPFYNQQDTADLKILKNLIQEIFVERGIRSMKKQLLSSKEKQVWSCECGKSNDVGLHCSGCTKDIYGFKANDITPLMVDSDLDQKLELIAEYLK